ncbi:MAG TPA: hypothetical protein VK638_42025 [Edaphobacter sp.]|nr:hypothetical protein [Edaphobacter sp.]
MKKMTGLPLFFALMLGMGTVQAPAAIGCTADRKDTTCDWGSFRAKLASAHVVRAEYGDMDRAAGSQLKELAKELGKTVATKDEPADLTFKVQPASFSGIDIGPADEEILQLLVYSGGRSQLVWVETYRGQKDRPWPANVHSAIQQFRERVAKQ